MTKQIIVKFDAPDNLRRALSRYFHGKKNGIATKKAVKDWAAQLIEQASLDLQLRLSRGKDLPLMTGIADSKPASEIVIKVDKPEKNPDQGES